MVLNKEDKKLYDKELSIAQKRNKKISIILDAEETDANWLVKRKKRKKIKED